MHHVIIKTITPMKPIQDQEKHYHNYQLNDDFYLKFHYNGIVVLFLN